MALICDNCGKGIVYGRQSSHHRGVAGKRWKKRAQTTLRSFKANIQKVSMVVNGKKVQLTLCTSCIKRFQKDGKLTKPSKVSTSAITA